MPPLPFFCVHVHGDQSDHKGSKFISAILIYYWWTYTVVAGPCHRFVSTKMYLLSLNAQRYVVGAPVAALCMIQRSFIQGYHARWWNWTPWLLLSCTDRESCNKCCIIKQAGYLPLKYWWECYIFSWSKEVQFLGRVIFFHISTNQCCTFASSISFKIQESYWNQQRIDTESVRPDIHVI